MYISIQWLQFCPAEDAVIRSARSQIKEDIMEGEEMPVVMAPLCGSNSGGSNKIKMRMSDGRSSKRRFSDAQVRSLECTFEAQTKLEPRRKAQLAGELGLQPRQVAVWFQNRRARWKSKELERECAALRADYDALLSSFESLEKEKQSLAATLQKLTELLEKPEDSNSGHPGDGNSERKENRDPISCLPVEGSLDRTLVGCSDEGELVGYMGQQEDRLCVSEPIISPSVPAEGRCCFDTSGCLSDQSCGTPTDWWELWPLN